MVNATGSKIRAGGVFFSEDGQVSISLKDDYATTSVLVDNLTTATSQAIVFDGAALGLNDSSVSEVAAGTSLGSNDGVFVTAAFDDSYKISYLTANGYSHIVFGEESISLEAGIQGSWNPKDADGANPANSLQPPVMGSVIAIKAKKDGYVAVWGRLSTNKSYFVFEEGSPIGYRLVMQTADTTLNKIDITYVGEGEYNIITDTLRWPEVVATGDLASAIKTTADGVIIFPVVKDRNYLVGAAGSKIIAGGVYFSEERPASIYLTGYDVPTSVLVSDMTTAITTISTTAATVASVKYYNLSGQEIKGLSKGINIVKRTMSDGTVQCVKVLNK